MKTKLTLLMIVLVSTINPLIAQVGINTENPQASLDVNGDLKVRTVPINNTSTDLLVLGADNSLHRNTTFLSSYANRSFVGATGGTTISLLNLTLLSGWNKIPFSSEEFDIQNNYDNTTTYEFTAPNAGLYRIYAQFETTGVVTAGEVGVAIFKKGVGDLLYTLLAQESYLNVSISVLTVGVGVSPPTRKVEKLVRLVMGDIITFGAKVPALSVTLAGGSKSFFTIEQVN